MLTRRLIEIVIFAFFWGCIGWPSLQFVYYKWLRLKLKLHKAIGDYPSLFLFIFILLIIYLLFRYLMMIIYAKYKLSERHLLSNLKQKCHNLDADAKRNVEAQISTETLLIKPTIGYRSKSTETFLSDQVDGKSMQNLSRTPIRPMMKQAKSLGNILEPEFITKKRNLNRTMHKKSIEHLPGNSKYQDAIYAELTESLRSALLKRSKSLGHKMNGGVDNLESSVEDLLQIYGDFYEMQNSLKREKRPIRKAPPLPPLPPTRPQIELHQKSLTFNAKNLAKNNTKFETVNEKCQMKRFK